MLPKVMFLGIGAGLRWWCSNQKQTNRFGEHRLKKAELFAQL
jgi:hypothetical protein